MKKIFATLFFLLSVFMTSNAQVKTVKLSSINAGSVWGGYCQVINLDKHDTTYYVYLSFYANHIGTNPVKSLVFISQAELNGFITDMESALAEMGSGADISWTRKLYSISIMKNSKNLYIAEKPDDGTAYTYIDKSKVKKLISQLKIIHL
jgi:hypothetical protein